MIAIVAILAVIIIPMIGKVRANSQSTQCTSNMRQLANAALLYAAENDGNIPAVYTTSGALDGSWVHKLWPYAGYSQQFLTASRSTGWNHFASSASNNEETSNIFICPSTRTMKSAVPGYGKVTPNSNVLSYGLNSVHPDGVVSPWTQQTPLNNIKSSTRTVMICESSFLLGDHGGYRTWFGIVPHRGSANFAFFDGHVERIEEQLVPNLSTAAGRTFWRGQ